MLQVTTYYLDKFCPWLTCPQAEVSIDPWWSPKYQSAEEEQPFEGKEDPAEVPNDDKAQEDNDSEDARWNGEVNVDADPDELDEDELGNDYCQTYFDNGEGDLSDDGLGGDDDDAGARYYD
ncbi:unnamed protein product [Dicrocoelium dendriticum]|nr:unnamed protein product [Dicrocoelium dendriticum]